MLIEAAEPPTALGCYASGWSGSSGVSRMGAAWRKRIRGS